MKKRYPLTLLAVIAVGALAAPTVQAHNALATPGCTGLAWSATNYNREVVNAIVVKVDGVPVHQDLDFKASDAGTAPWSQTATHTWSVVVNAPGSQYDRSFSGTWQACVVVPTTTTVAATTTTTVPSSTTVVVTTTDNTEPSTTTTVVTTPPTTALVAVDIPPVPCQYNPTVPADSPDCVAPSTVVASDVVSVEPALPRTGAGETVGFIGLALLMVAVGGYLAIKGRRVR